MVPPGHLIKEHRLSMFTLTSVASNILRYDYQGSVTSVFRGRIRPTTPSRTVGKMNSKGGRNMSRNNGSGQGTNKRDEGHTGEF